MPHAKHIRTSPYLVATPQGYTKHYYAENERVASKVGTEKFAGLHAVCLTTVNVSAAYSEVCLIGTCRYNSATEWNAFGQQMKGFKGSLYLRPQPHPAPPAFPPIDSSLLCRNILKRL